MKKAMCVFGMLAMVASASATVRVFVTGSASGYGLANNANAFTPTVSSVTDGGSNFNTYDYYTASFGAGPIRPGVYPPAAAPSGTLAAPVQVDSGFAYVWLQFQSEPAATINGLGVQINNAGTTTPAAVTTAWYLCNNVTTTGNKRWDGAATPPSYPELTNNPQISVSVTAYGIRNLVPATAEQLWSGAAAGRIALMGAIAAPFDGSIYSIDITLINYSDSGLPTPSVAGGFFQFTPEPTSLLLLGVVGLLVRRR
jgi:hypothetical protein